MAKLGRLNSLEELYSAFGDLFPDKLIEPAEQGANSRSRTFSGRVTFWAFAAQILSPGSSCREIVRRVEAWWEHREGATPGDEQFDERILPGAGESGS